MINQVNEGDTLKFTAGADIVAGKMVVQGSIVGVLANTVANGKEGILLTRGVYNYAKLSTDVVGLGAPLYYDAGNDRLTLTASTHKFAGNAWSVAGNGVTTVDVKLAGRSTI